MTQPAKKQAGSQVTLNVIFHGMFALVFWDSGVEVLTAPVKDHVFLAGTWMKERKLARNTIYTLEGITGGPRPSCPAVDNTCNPCVKSFRELDRRAQKLVCSFELPFPSKVYSSRRIAKNAPGQPDIGDIFAGKHAAQVNPSLKEVSEIQTLAYAVNDSSQLAIRAESSTQTGFPWKPVVKPVGGQNYVNLHVWAETPKPFPDGDYAHEHVIMGFQQMARLFPELDLRPVQFCVGPKQLYPPPGVDPGELTQLSDRASGKNPRAQVIPPFICQPMIVMNTTP